MIPVRDTLEARGPVPATLGLIIAYFVLALFGDIPHLFIPVLCTAGLHLALAPRSKTLSLLLVPFGSTFFEVPTYIIAIAWLALEFLLFAV